MNDLHKLKKACLECIEAWKKENDGKPLDIVYGDYISHCYNYGGDGVRHLYDDYVYDEDEQQDNLRAIEKSLLIKNVGEEKGNRIYIGRRIAEMRNEIYMTQNELADLAGIKKGNLERIETGKYSISLDILARIAKALGTNIDFI